MPSKELSESVDQPEPRKQERHSPEGPGRKTSMAGRIYPGGAAKVAAGIGVFAISAAAFYRVREILAALLLFSVLFGVVIVAILIMWLVGEATHEAAVRVESHLTRIPARHIAALSHVHSGHILKNPHWRL